MDDDNSYKERFMKIIMKKYNALAKRLLEGKDVTIFSGKTKKEVMSDRVHAHIERIPHIVEGGDIVFI